MGGWRPRSVTEYLNILWRRKLLILGLASGVFIVGFVAVGRMPNVYESRAVLLISAQDSNVEALSARISEVTQDVTSRSSLQPLIERHDLKGSANSDIAVENMRNRIKVQTRLRNYYPEFPESITITYRHEDPRVAQQVVIDLVATFERENEAMREQAEDEANWLGSQMTELEKQLNELGPHTGFPVANGGGQITDPRMAREALVSTIEALTDKQYALERQISEQKRQIAEHEELVEARPATASIDNNGGYGALIVRKAELDALLGEYATQYTERNTKVIQVQAQLQEINRQLALLDGKKPVGTAANPDLRELRALERELIKLETDLEITRRELGREKAALEKLPDVEATAAGESAPNLNRAEAVASYERVLKRYNSVVEKYDLIQKTRMAADGGVLFRMVDSPNVPEIPAGPKRTMYRAVALALGLGMGLFAGGLAEVRRLFLIHDHRDVAYFLGVPLLAVIPETSGSVQESTDWRHMLARKFAVLRPQG